MYLKLEGGEGGCLQFSMEGQVSKGKLRSSLPHMPAFLAPGKFPHQHQTLRTTTNQVKSGRLSVLTYSIAYRDLRSEPIELVFGLTRTRLRFVR